jgi:glycosyltransferase involved in cell wall biosynthesis
MTSNSPFFSVVVPTYNRSDKLLRSLNSVLAQTFGDFELLVMDDGSNDNTDKIVNELQDERIVYIWAPNSGGPATPRNRGLKIARAPWIAFLDADDVWYPQKLETIALSIKSNVGVDVFCHNEYLVIAGEQGKTVLNYGPYEPDFYKVMLEQGNRLSTSAVTVRSEFLRTHNLTFNQSSDFVIVEDFDFWLHLARLQAGFKFIPLPLGEYLIEGDNISLSTARLRRNLESVLRDHIFHYQVFTAQKEALWRRVRLRLELEEAKDKFVRKDILGGVRGLLKSFVMHPVQSAEIYLSRCRFKKNL